MSDTNQAISGQVVGSGGDLATLPPDMLAKWESMFEAVPDGGGDGGLSILEDIANAASPADLDGAWRSSQLEALHDVPIVVVGIRKAPSDYDGGLPYFLIIDAAIRATGEKITVTTGSISVVAQLVKAWQWEAAVPGSVFPLAVVPRKARKPSANGFYPMHLDLVR